MSSATPTLGLEVVTPEGIVEKTRATLVEFPSEGGELGIFPGHAPLVAVVSAGEMRIYREDGLHVFAVAGGFAQINPDSVRMVVSFAADSASENLDIEAACARAKDALDSAGTASKAAMEADLALLKTGLLRLREKKPGSRVPRRG